MTELKLVSSLSDVEALESKPWSETAPARSTYELLSQAAAKHGDKTAIRFLPTGSPDEDPITLNFKQFFGRITQAANMLADLGVGPEDTTAILLPLLPQTHFALWGAEAAGIASPINFLLSPNHIADLLNSSKAKVLVALGPHPMLDIWEKVESIRKETPNLKVILKVTGEANEAEGIYSFDETIAKYPADKLTFDRNISPENVASYFHTGGTTGAPKLAQHTHGMEVYAAWAVAAMWNIKESDSMLSGLPLFHVGGAFAASLAPLCQGADILIPSPGGLRSPVVVENIWRLVEKYKLTSMGGIPTSLVAMNQVPIGDADISTLRYGLSGGSALPVQVEREITEKMDRKIAHIYGATEATVCLALTPVGGDARIGSCGMRLPYEELKIVRLDTIGTTYKECPANESGVVMAKGPNIFPGYLNPEQTKGTLTGDGWLITGDLGYLDEDGFLFLTGRSKDLIIRSGHNIDPAIIEEAAVQHPAVAMAAAVGKPDEYAGELPVLYVQLTPEATASPEEIHSFLQDNISERPALPKEILIIDAIPTTAVGKIFKPQLRWEQAERHFQQQLSYLEEQGLSVKVKVGESSAQGTLCSVTLSSSNNVDQARIESEIAAKLEKNQYISFQVNWE